MRPPRLASRLVALFASTEDRRCMLDDLAEEFSRVASERGPRAARAWYWHQAAGSIWPLLRQRLVTFPQRSVMRVRWQSGALGDSVQGMRWLRRHAGLATVSVATLTAAFSSVLAGLLVADAALFRPLSYPAPDRLVRVWVSGPSRPNVRSVSRSDFIDWRDRATSFDALSAHAAVEFRLTGRGSPRQIPALRVAEGFDRVLGVTAAAGRTFEVSDFAKGAERVIVLRHEFWRSEFGADPSIVGRTLVLDETPHRIVGILPETRLAVPSVRHDVWVPLVPRAGAFWEDSRGSGWMSVAGRLRPHVSIAAAESELTAIALDLSRQYPNTNRDKVTAHMTRELDEIAGPVRPMLQLLAVALSAVLVIACGNLVNLLLASAASRRREFAVRAAIGAGRTRVFRQLLAENLIITTAAGAFAVTLAPIVARAFVALYPDPVFARLETATGAMTIVTAVLVLVVTIVLTLPQFLHVTRSEPRTGLEGMGHAPNRRGFAKQALVAVQIALSIALVAAGAGLVRTVTRLTDLDPGFRSDGVLTFGVSPSPTRFTTGPAMLQFYRSVLDEIRAIPGVRSAAAAVAVPLTSSAWQFGLRPDPNAPEVLVAVNLVTAQYFDVLGIPVRAGRTFTDEEDRSSSSLVVVNEALGRLIAPGGAAVGRDFRYSGRSWRVIGVVGSARQRRLREPPMPELFIPWNQAAREQTIVVRADGDPLRLLPAIAAAVQRLDPSAPLGNPATLDRRLSEARRGETFRASLVTALAALAVALAAFGAYGITAFSVARRTREFGIRAALGESRRSIAWRALWTAGAPAVYGALLGTAAAIVAARWLNTFMYETDARDWTTVAGATLLVFVISLAAAARCARVAARTNPVDALRTE